jgi:hypothetical protein
MLAPLPGGFQFGPSDVPVQTAFLQHSTQVLPKLFDGWSAEKPVAVVNLEYNETRFEDHDMGDHRIVFGVRVLGDVEKRATRVRTSVYRGFLMASGGGPGAMALKVEKRNATLNAQLPGLVNSKNYFSQLAMEGVLGRDGAKLLSQCAACQAFTRNFFL